MKIKHCLMFALLSAPAAAVLRLLQYLFIIDGEGYFTAQSLPQYILQYSVYAILAISVIAAFIAYFSGDKTQPDSRAVIGGKVTGIVLIAAAAAIMVSCGIYISAPVAHVPLTLCYVMAASGILAAIYLAAAGVGAFTGADIGKMSFVGIFTPIYVVLVGICVFYTSFNSAHKSETQLFMLAICVLALLINALCLASSGAPVSTRRVIATATAYPAFAFASAISPFASNALDVQDVLFSAILIAFAAVAVIAMVRVYYIKPAPEPESESEIDEVLDIFLDEIPEQEQTEETVRGDNE